MKGFGIIPKELLTNPHLSIQSKALYSLLASFVSRDGIATMSRKTLAKALGKSTRMISTYCQELETADYLKRTFQEGATTTYLLTKHLQTLETYFNTTLEAERNPCKELQDPLEANLNTTLEAGFPHNSTKENSKSKTPYSPPKEKRRKPKIHPDAEKIYNAYPRKVKKKPALLAITEVIDGGHDPTALLETTTAFGVYWKQRKARTPDEWKFCPHPTTWFNSGRYDDDPDEWILPDEQAQSKQQHNNGKAHQRTSTRTTDGQEQLAELQQRIDERGKRRKEEDSNIGTKGLQASPFDTSN